jgi:molecular chaperone Hsp33
MAGDDGVIGVDCAFCSRIFPLALDSFNTDSPASASAAN